MTPPRTRPRTLVLAGIDAVAYGLTVAALATGLSVSLGLATGGGFVRGKELLFVAGWLLLAYATVSLWPSFPDDLDDSQPVTDRAVPESDEQSRVQSLSRKLPPIRWIQLPPPEERITIEGKLFVAGLIVLLASFLMETWAGIR